MSRRYRVVWTMILRSVVPTERPPRLASLKRKTYSLRREISGAYRPEGPACLVLVRMPGLAAWIFTRAGPIRDSHPDYLLTRMAISP